MIRIQFTVHGTTQSQIYEAVYSQAFTFFKHSSFTVTSIDARPDAMDGKGQILSWEADVSVSG